MAVPPAPGGLAWSDTLELRAADGVALRAALWRGGGRGLCLLLPGRTEFLEKLTMVAAPLVARGFAVASLDWRGQGLSERRVDPPEKGHVGDFAEYCRDLAALAAAPQVEAEGPVRLVLAHSMGAAVALTAGQAGVIPRTPAIFSAPMWGLGLGRGLRAAAWAVVQAARLMGRSDRWPPFGETGAPYVETVGLDENVLTSDAEVFGWLRAAMAADPRLVVGTPSIAWFGAATAAMARLSDVPPLDGPGLCLLGSEDAVVDNAAARRLAGRLGCEVAEVTGARHEPLIEATHLRTGAWAAVDAFLGRAGL